MGTCAGAGICLAIAVLSMTGCEGSSSKRAALTEPEVKRLTLAMKPNRPDQLVVCGETITWEDAIASLPEEAASGPSLKERLEKAARETSLQQFIEQQGPLVQERLYRRIVNIVRAARAERDLGKQKVDEKLDEYADRELRRFILEEHGGNGAAADEALQKMGMTRVTYKQWRKKQILASQTSGAKDPQERPITYNELLARYEAMKNQRFAQQAVLQIRLIDIEIAKVKVQGPGDDPTSKARALAEDLRQKIDAGEDFAALAKQYSHDARAEQGGLWRPRNPESLAAPYDVLAEKAKSTPQGQVAGPIEAPGHFFVMRVEGKQETSYQPLSEVQDEVRKDIQEQRRSETLRELNAEIDREVSVADTSHFLIYGLEKFYRQAREADRG